MTLKSVVYKIPNKPENKILRSDFDNEITIDATSSTSRKGRPNKEFNKFGSYSSLIEAKKAIDLLIFFIFFY